MAKRARVADKQTAAAAGPAGPLRRYSARTRRTREPRRSCVAQATALCAGPLFVCLFCLFAGPLFALDLSACAIFKTLLAAAGIKPQAMAMHTLLLPPNEVSHRRVRAAQMLASPGADVGESWRHLGRRAALHQDSPPSPRFAVGIACGSALQTCPVDFGSLRALRRFAD